LDSRPSRSLLYYILQLISEPKIESLKTQDGLNDLFKALSIFIQKYTSLRTELGPVSKRSGEKLTEDERRAYIELCVLAWQEKHLDRNFTLSNGTAAMIYLKSFNIFAQKINDHIKLIAPRFVASFLKAEAMSVFSSLFDRRYGDIPLMFEMVFIELAVLIQSWGSENPFIGLIPAHQIPAVPKINFWQNRGPKVIKGGKLDTTTITTILKNRGNSQEEENYGAGLDIDHLPYFIDHLPLGDAFVFGQMSSSVDGIFKMNTKKVIEWQAKTGNQFIKNTKRIQVEVEKSIAKISQDYTSILLLLYADGVEKDYFITNNKPDKDFVGLILPPNMTLLIPSTQAIEKYLGPGLLRKFR